ncbi:GH3 auxin-responsive promoter family protein [Planctomicrobium sp. SH661]|uniref:GH3 auxin-responsive promoter family protein n=1 Tax=Planctomicrobium sp. SH661 TaxID=3448124 RepID=UPI003F5B1974
MLSDAQDCRRTQARTLRRLLRLNAGSDFQSDFGLDHIRRVRQFRRALPVAGYDRVAPYVEQLKLGKHSALLGRRNRLRMFALTSGTTSQSKFIPITQRFLRDYRKGWQAWGIQAFDAHPRLHQSEIFQLSSQWDQFRTAGGIPCGNISGLVQQMQSRLLRLMYVVPPAATHIPDPFEKLYFALKHGLCSRSLGMMMTANPSTLCQLFRILSEHSESLVRDLYEGSDRDANQLTLPPRLRRVQNRSRARELDRILQSTGTLRPSDVWPNLQMVAVWTGGSAAAYLPILREYIGDVPIRDHGLHASEGRMTIPLEDETSHGLLDIGTHFFEFIPEEQIHSPNPDILLAHELVEDEAYFIIMTTSSGLYRYDIRDVVQCTGFVGTTPLLRFLHKGSHISNLTGEKLTESQVVHAVTTVAQKLQLRLDHFTVTPEWGDPPRYVLLVDESRLHNIDLIDHFADQVEAELLRGNSEYQEKRRSARLAPLGVLSVPRGDWHDFIRTRQTQLGGSAEQYKHPYLMPKLEFLSQFQERYPTPFARRSGLPSQTIH